MTEMMPNNTHLQTSPVNRQDTLCPCAVGPTWSGRGCREEYRGVQATGNFIRVRLSSSASDCTLSRSQSSRRDQEQASTLSEGSGTTEYTEKEGDMVAVCDLADDLRDAIVEYQVGVPEKMPTIGSAHSAQSSRNRMQSTSKTVN
jgi:hypothetical protein